MVSTSRILGPDGQPIRLADLAEPQTSRTMQLRNEFAAHPSRGLTPQRLANILDAAETGDLIRQFELYEDMEERDGHIASEMGKRRGALQTLDWDIVPPPSPYQAEKNAAKRLRELLQDIDFESTLMDVTDAIGKGFCCLEIEWQRLDGAWVPKTITHRPQTWFRVVRGYTQEIRLRGQSAEGEPLQPFGWIVHTHKAKSGYLERAGFFRALVWPYLFKNYAVGDLAEFLEIYGIPLRLGKYPPGAGEKEKTTLLRALSSLGHNAAGIIPDGMLVEFHDAATGDPKAFELMMNWCERTQSKVILGGTLTSQADGKSSTNALGEIHEKVRRDLLVGDAKQVAATLTRDLIYPIAALNGLVPRGIRRAPRFVFNLRESADMNRFAAALPTLLGSGMRIPRQWAQERVGIPEPEADDDDLLRPVSAPQGPVEVAALSAQLAGAESTPTRLQTEVMAREAAGQWETILARIEQLVGEAPDLPSLREALYAEYSNLPREDLAEVMAMGFASADLAGRFDTTQESGRA